MGLDPRLVAHLLLPISRLDVPSAQPSCVRPFPTASRSVFACRDRLGGCAATSVFVARRSCDIGRLNREGDRLGWAKLRWPLLARTGCMASERPAGVAAFKPS